MAGSLCMHSISDAPHTLWNVPVDLMAIGEVNVSIDKEEGVEPSQVVSKEEESSEDTVAVEGYVTLVDVSGNEASVVVDVVVVIFGRESSVGCTSTAEEVIM